MSSADWLARHIEELNFRLSELERRDRNRRRKGKIVEVSEDNSKYRVELSRPDGTPFLTPFIKARTLSAGGVKVDVLHSVGEQVDVVSESGDLADGQIDFSTYSDDNARENTNTPLHIKIADTLIQADGELVQVKAQKVVVMSDNVQLGGDGGKPVAREGDLVHVKSGSSEGYWEIVKGSERVFAVD